MILPPLPQIPGYATVGFSVSAGLSADVQKCRLPYGVAEQKCVCRAVLYNGFRFVLGNCDWSTSNTQWRRLS